ncbi:MAG: DUF2073 domain-containing protein [Candidatus Aenigmarchaeota archaeon]|nr:DUF2073 domain-containing protein [Candidatus Aenigmarchaeota archaeon]
MIKIKLLPYESVRGDFKKVFKALQDDHIVLIDAKLDPDQEAGLIKDTMERFSDRFAGIELSSLESPLQTGGLDKVKSALAEMLTGKKRGFTIIGPASIVRKIKKNPQELLVYM